MRTDAMPINKERLILFHVPKCGGVTVYRTLSRYFDRYITSHDVQDESTASVRAPFIATHTTFTLFKYIPREDWTVTLLREPQRRLRSQYRFWAGINPSAPENAIAASETKYLMKLARELSFVEFLGVKEGPLVVHLDNVMVRHFADFAYEGEKVREKHLKMACENLEKIDDIMTTETLEQDLSDLAARLGRAPAYQMQKGNVTDELYIHHPDQHTYVSADITADNAYRNAVEPLIAYDRRLYAYAKALKERRASDRNRTYHRFLDIPGVTVFEITPNVTYTLANSPASRAMLWGEWSSQDDTRGWTIGQFCWIQFKVRRSELARLEKPTLGLKIEAFLPPARTTNRVDLKVAGSDARRRILFLNTGQAQDPQVIGPPVAGASIVVAGARCAIDLPLSAQGSLLEDDRWPMASADAATFAYFRIDLSNLPNLPATQFGVGDSRNLGVAINELLLRSPRSPQLTTVATTTDEAQT
jgi:hypothetical protein